MENGTVNGYGWPVIGHRPGWEKVTKYRVDPGFYDVDIDIIANAKAYDGLAPEAQKILADAALSMEAEAIEKDSAMASGAGKKQLTTGFEQILFEGEQGEKWSNAARDAGWEGIIKASPENGPKLRTFFEKAK